MASALVTLNETANATISCAVYGCPEAAVTWRKNGRRIKLYEKDIKFTRIRNSNAGNYTCLAKNVYSNASSTFQLIVNCKCTFSDIFIITFGSHTSSLGKCLKTSSCHLVVFGFTSPLVACCLEITLKCLLYIYMYMHFDMYTGTASLDVYFRLLCR